jgi:hypothetical protein
MQEIKIRELSRPSVREWIPPIGAMGGPPAHELYRDLVLYAGLRLLKDPSGNPRVAIQDGAHRRTFSAPSTELREAIDRFRMRRSLRPVPDGELAELIRIVQARVSDPDILIPVDDPPAPVGSPTPRPAVGMPEPNLKTTRLLEALEENLDKDLREIDQVRYANAARPATAKAPSAWTEVVSTTLPITRPRVPANTSISGARTATGTADGIPRYFQVLQSLIRDGGWLGTTAELARLTGDDPRKVVASLLGLRSELARSNIVVASVETREGWRWLAVDKTRLSSVTGSQSSTSPDLQLPPVP